MAVLKVKPWGVSSELADKKKFIDDNIDILIFIIKCVKVISSSTRFIKQMIEGFGSYVFIR